jgi:hypothetical protein
LDDDWKVTVEGDLRQPVTLVDPETGSVQADAFTITFP